MAIFLPAFQNCSGQLSTASVQNKAFVTEEAVLVPIGDGVTDDTEALQDLFDRKTSGDVVDLGLKTYLISRPIKLPPGIEIKNGTVQWVTSDSLFGAFVAADDDTFTNMNFKGPGLTGAGEAPLYQVAIYGGSTSRSQRRPANRVKVIYCAFRDMTVGIFAGGDSGDPTPVGWQVLNNLFSNIVGKPGLSEGYGVLFGPASQGTISRNRFEKIRRHAIYLGGNASQNVVDRNDIDGVDNIAIQSNTYVYQDFADGNVISNNLIKNITRSVDYGYPSAVGIGLYGKFSNVTVSGNHISESIHGGIVIGGESGTSAYGRSVHVANNYVTMNSSMAGSAIHIDGTLSGLIEYNDLSLNSRAYGIALTSTYGISVEDLSIEGNVIRSTEPLSIGIRVALSAPRVVKISGNQIYGVPSSQTIVDTSTAGKVNQSHATGQ